MNDLIQVFVTGGTFDKEYNFITGKLYFKETHLTDMFERGRSQLNLDIKTLMMVDSLEMSDEDRNLVVASCAKTTTNKVIITHGTDTMVHTAEVLASTKALLGKTIVLTGAMIPIAFGTSSDGFFNLGSALAFVQCLDPGVYIAMNGRYFNWDNVEKNLESGYFRTIK